MGQKSSCVNDFCSRKSEIFCECASVFLCYPCLSGHIQKPSKAPHKAYFTCIFDDFISNLFFVELKYQTSDHNTELYEVVKNNKKYAVKIQICLNSEDLNKKQEEANLMRSMTHKNICRCIKSFIYSGTSGCRILILMEYCKTDLEEEIIKRLIEKNPYNESELLTNMKNLIDALAYMQKNHLAHRDIKPANILVFNNTLKIADFGLSLQQEESFETIDYKCVGTVVYLSPILKKTYLAMIEGKL